MKLLLDEMHAPEVAARLRARGHDVVAVKERRELTALPDRELLRMATSGGRVLVTENVKDFAGLHTLMAAAGEYHAGLVFTHPRRFPRHVRNHITTLTNALAGFLASESRLLDGVDSFVWWLQPSSKFSNLS